MAPDFRARSTAGDLRLSDYRGKWVMLFAHPADFTPVCSTEFVALAKRQHEFDALDCQLIGLSIDSLHAHLAWVRALKDVFGVEITFPVVEDPSMAIVRAYGMLDEHAADSAAIRSTFIMDPHGTIRAITCYPPDVGRSVDEMLRMVDALQFTEEHGEVCPAGWQKGRTAMKPDAAGVASYLAEHARQL